MTTPAIPPELRERLWDPSAAAQGLEHWRTICAADPTPAGAGQDAGQLRGLLLVFGASWHFSRHAFARGPAVLECIPASADQAPACFAGLLRALEGAPADAGAQDGDAMLSGLSGLRSGKNAAMICALAAFLQGWWDQRRLEQALTQIADTVIRAMVRLFGLEGEAGEELLVLGMGRLAAGEMNFASDLDLIFLGRGGAPYLEALPGQVRRLLQAMRRYAPDGVLYAIDMRLRPHGRAGTLISSCARFLDFHRQPREVWERQMMTRHRLIHAGAEIRTWFEEQLHSALYVPQPAAHLGREIRAMRRQVEEAAGAMPGQYDLKRGRGGLMDIDFICHYFQLLHGHEQQPLRTAATRAALRHIAQLSLLPARQAEELCGAYDFLKRVECALRVYDMKTTSSFRSDSPRLSMLARAAGHAAGETGDFLDRYHQTTDRVRRVFTEVLGA